MPRPTDDDWTLIGQHEPYYGVLSHERFLRRNLTPQIMDEFWRTGVDEIGHLTAVIERHLGDFRPVYALDFGCGVGRLSRAMAAVADQVLGVDVAEGMLVEARRGAPANLSFCDVLPPGPFDWINSIIVFQHIPPSRGYPLFEELLDRLAPGGVLSAQFTLYRDKAFLQQTICVIEEAVWDGEDMRSLRQAPPPPGTMLMYDYDLTRLIASAVRRGVEQFFLEHTDHSGCHGVRIYARRAC